MIVVVDCVHFQSESEYGNGALVDGLQRLASLCSKLILLDRGWAPSIESAQIVPFPRYSRSRFNAADSILLEAMARSMKCDLLVSTGFTSPLSIPQILFWPSEIEAQPGRETDEKKLSWVYSHALVCSVPFVGTQMRDLPSRPIVDSLDDALELSAHSSDFYDRWARLRRIQDEIDPVIWGD